MPIHVMNNARKLTLLENAIRRITEEGLRDMKSGNYASADSLSVEAIDLIDWLNDLNSGPDQREECALILEGHAKAFTGVNASVAGTLYAAAREIRDLEEGE